MPELDISVPINDPAITYVKMELSNNAGFSQSSSEIEIVRRVVPISNICFPAGTRIKTDQGFIDIEKIDVKKHTINTNKIVAVTETRSMDDTLVCFPVNSLGENIPSEVTIVSNDHLIQNPVTNKMIKARDYVSFCSNVTKVDYKDDLLYNILLETHDVMEVNNMVCETLYPFSMIALLYQKLSTVEEEESKQIWIENYNLIVNGTNL
jgi:hypothetical protein